MSGTTLLIIAAVFDFILALLHVAMLPYGSRAYAYFDAGEWMVSQAKAGSSLPHLMTLGVATVLTLFGVYALSGAGAIPPWPFLRLALVVLSGIYILRGLAFLPQLIMLARKSTRFSPKDVGFSLTSLVVGLLHGTGTLAVWESLP